MKSLLKSIGILMFVIMILNTSSLVFARDKEVEYFNEYKNTIEEMYKTMKNIPKSGNVDLDYLYEMTAHHEGAVNISKNYLEYNKWTKEVKELSEEIIKKQTENNKHMQSMINEVTKTTVVDKNKESQYILEYSDILSKMYNNLINLKPTGKIDMDYMEALMIHHQSSIKIFDLILKYSDNNDIKKMVEEEKEAQNLEMSKINMILQKSKDFKTHDLK